MLGKQRADQIYQDKTAMVENLGVDQCNVTYLSSIPKNMVAQENVIRDSMYNGTFRWFRSRPIQAILTILTGKPHTGQKPFAFGPWYFLIIVGILPVLIGTAISIFAVTTKTWWGLLPGWFLTTNGMRALRLQVMHYASHGFVGTHNIRRNAIVDIALGEAISILLLTDNFPDYAYEHIKEHHGKGHMTMADPTVRAVILKMGLRAGKPLGWQQRRLLMTLLSPIFHLEYVVTRILGHYTNKRLRRLKHIRQYPVSRWIHAVLTTIYLTLILALGTITNGWLTIILAWILPLTLFFQISTCLRLVTRHRFPKPGPRLRSTEELAGFTAGIFMGEQMPSCTWRSPVSMLRFTVWLLRMILIHFPARALVIVGDSVAHDLHHRYSEPESWTDFIFRREAALAVVDPKWEADLTEVWGIKNAVNTVLQSIASADPAMFEVKPRHKLTAGRLFRAIDD